MIPAQPRSNRWHPLRFADMNIGRKLVTIVILCVGAGFMVMIGVQITGTRADLHNLAYYHSLEVTELLADSVAGGVRWQQPEAVERSYQPFLDGSQTKLVSVVALDIDGQVLAAHDSGALRGVDLSLAIEDAQEVLRHDDLYSVRASDHIVVVAPVLIGREQTRVGTLAVAWSLVDLNALISANLDRQGILAGFSLVALVVILLALLSYIVSLPLKAVSRATMLIAQSETAVPIPETRRRDEIGEMARALEVFKQHLEMIDEMSDAQEEHRRQLSEALENERKYNALHREFVAMASHEFRTPLAIIDGAAQRIIRRAERMTPEELLERVGKIRHAVSRMIGLIDSTLSASRMEAGRVELSVELCSLKKILEGVCNRQQEIAPEHRIQYSLENAPDLIIADPRHLDQILTNLLSNAVKYSPQKGPVEVKATREGEMAAISVRDYGVGIPKDELPKLFERFFRASTSTGIPGTGIGLNLVKELIEMHGGSIDVVSTERDGSTFTIHVPVNGPAGGDEAVQSSNHQAGLAEARIRPAAECR